MGKKSTGGAPRGSLGAAVDRAYDAAVRLAERYREIDPTVMPSDVLRWSRAERKRAYKRLQEHAKRRGSGKASAGRRRK